jgi:large subunit ribosomal protein L32
MAVPKRRVIKTRAAKRITHYKLKLARPVKDADGTWRMPHHINKTTGEYRADS